MYIYVGGKIRGTKERWIRGLEETTFRNSAFILRVMEERTGVFCFNPRLGQKSD